MCLLRFQTSVFVETSGKVLHFLIQSYLSYFLNTVKLLLPAALKVNSFTIQNNIDRQHYVNLQNLFLMLITF